MIIVILQISGDENSASGSFTVQYDGQTFIITLSYKQGSEPTFTSERKPDLRASLNYTVKEMTPVIVTGNKAQVVFEITNDQKP